MPVMPQDRLAFDRAPSARRIDQDGHMHVADVPISKATVNPYRGREIPDWQRLGLDGDRIYQLLRDPGELEKAAGTFNGKPLLSLHPGQAQTADNHDHAQTVGAVHNVRWDPPYLRAGDLHVWPGEAIAGIESGEQRELSASYRYDADMAGGAYDGTAYDGVMRNIRANHVALVPKGRAGSDVVVNDAAMNAGGGGRWVGKFVTADTDWHSRFAQDAQERDSDGKFSGVGGGAAGEKAAEHQESAGAMSNAAAEHFSQASKSAGTKASAHHRIGGGYINAAQAHAAAAEAHASGHPGAEDASESAYRASLDASADDAGHAFSERQAQTDAASSVKPKAKSPRKR